VLWFRYCESTMELVTKNFIYLFVEENDVMKINDHVDENQTILSLPLVTSVITFTSDLVYH
jgi:hypothetical protein